ncbi:MAG TPA: hypothetical protein VF075_08545, partial [Pyrinomonadaceae bacterium]
MKRIALCSTAFLLFLACTIPVVNGQKVKSHSSTVTVVLRGLMVVHPDPAREYFEAGILPAPGHRFRVEV